MTDYHTTQRHLFIKNSTGLVDRLKTAGAIVFVVLAFGIVGRMDYDDAVAMEAAQNGQQPQAVQVADAAPAVCK